MKKLLFLLLVVAMSLGACSRNDKYSSVTFRVERALSVSVGSETLTDNALKGDVEVTIGENGYLVIVDDAAKKRYMITQTGTKKVCDFINSSDKPKDVTQNYIEGVITNLDSGSEKASVGTVSRGGSVELQDVENNYVIE